MKQRIYLDNNATTGLDPRVLEAMLPELSTTPNNPSSVHYFGQQAKADLSQARETIATFLGVKSQEIIFTSGGTESMNLLLRGFFPSDVNGHAITSNVEHSCVYQTLKHLEERGLEVDFLPAGLFGAIMPDQVKAAIRPNTRFIVLTAASNETGVKTRSERNWPNRTGCRYPSHRRRGRVARQGAIYRASRDCRHGFFWSQDSCAKRHRLCVCSILFKTLSSDHRRLPRAQSPRRHPKPSWHHRSCQSHFTAQNRTSPCNPSHGRAPRQIRV